MKFLNKIKQLCRFATRRPVAQIFRSECLDEAMAIQIGNPPTFESIPQSKDEVIKATQCLLLHGNALSDAERSLRKIESAVFAGTDARFFTHHSKVATSRRACLDDITFLKRATALGFSEDNLALALNSAMNSQKVWQSEFESAKAALEARLRSAIAGGSMKMLMLG